MSFSLQSLHTTLMAQCPAGATGMVVAYSGGLDSSVLLRAMAALREEFALPLRAIHVDHQIHADSALWAAHCEQIAAALNVPLERVAVTLQDVQGRGVEASARQARYSALRAFLKNREILLTAHHADDQAETLLLALMRGTGVRGLAGMPARRMFGSGWHLRPLLEFRRVELASWAREEGMRWLEDPSNASRHFARNLLRADVMPTLLRRWPGTVRQITRTAAHLRESAELLDELAQIDAAQCLKGRCIELASLQLLSAARRRNLLRWWLRQQGARTPSAAKLQGLQTDVTRAAADRVPFIDVDELRIYRHRGLLYAERLAVITAEPAPMRWQWRAAGPRSLPLGGGLGVLGIEPVDGAGLASIRLPDVLEVRYRRGGENLRVANAGPHRSLKNLLQEASVLPWWRERLPLVYVGDRLLAVADLWTDVAMRATHNESAVRIVWHDRPELFASKV